MNISSGNIKSLKFSYSTICLSALQILAASLIIALFAKISIPLYFTSVPFTGQTLGIMLIGATLGARKGALSALAYLLEGSFGLPIFAEGGFGIIALFGPRCGYLLGFVLQAYLVGFIFERKKAFKDIYTLMSLLLICALQLGLGVIGLAVFIGGKQAILLGFYPFIIGESAKALLVLCYVKCVLRK